jgi:hypothetical protein
MTRKDQVEHGDPSRGRTCNPQLRRLVLYPVELWGRRPRLKQITPKVAMKVTMKLAINPCAFMQMEGLGRRSETPI